MAHLATIKLIKYCYVFLKVQKFLKKQVESSIQGVYEPEAHCNTTRVPHVRITESIADKLLKECWLVFWYRICSLTLTIE